MKKLVYLILAAVALVAVLSGCGHKVEGVPGTVAVVNGTSISGDAYLEELHRKQGEQVLRSLIERGVLLDWAKSLKVAVTQEQVDKELDMLKREGQYDDAVKELGVNVLTSEMEQRQARINISKKLFKFSKKDMEEQYGFMKDRYVHGPRKMVALIISPKKERVEEAAKKIKGGMDFDEASDLYTDRRFAPRGTIKTWIDVEQTQLPAELRDAVKKTKEGQVSKVFTLGVPGTPSNYAIVKVLKSEGKASKTLDQVKDEVLAEAAWRKTMMDQKFDTQFRERKKKAKITIDVPRFRGLIQDFKNPPEMPSMFGPQPGPPPPRR